MQHFYLQNLVAFSPQKNIKMINQKPQDSQISDEQVQLTTSNRQQEIAQLSKIPKYMAFNEHITQGYRLNFKNPFQILKSLFIFHNETVNIWSHLLGAMMVFSFIIWFFVVIDKAEVEYQLKKYEANLNQGFSNLNDILHQIEKTLEPFENAQQSHTNKRDDFDQFTFQLKKEYEEVKESVKEEIVEIRKVLQYEVQLTEQQKKYRQKISAQLGRFEQMQKRFQKSILKVLREDFEMLTDLEVHDIQIMRRDIEQISNDINRHVIQYLELQKHTPNPYGIPRWPVIIFLFTATLCLGFSATFHLFYPMSSKAFKYFRRFDYAGVILNIVGTGIPPIYYSLYCKPVMASIYLTVMIVFGVVLFVVLLQNWIHKNKNKKYKPIMFGLFGLTYVIPYSHFMISQTFFDNFGDSYKFSHSNFWWVASSSSYLFGLWIFIKKWPQSRYKNKFDFIGNSHQIWHFLCLCGVAATYIAININYQTRKQCACA